VQSPPTQRVLAWVVLIIATLVLLKIVAIVFFGVLQALFTVALVVAAVLGILWALRHV
jgi:predicted membrane protein